MAISFVQTLFLDRDGVLNRRIPDDYVRSIAQWEWLPNVLEALAILSRKFETIVLVSNQQGVGKGWFSQEDLQTLTDFFLAEITQNGGRIDKAYYCTHLKTDECTCRKPLITMALQAQSDFPKIVFSQSLMLGDSLSDMQFGKNAGMKTVFIKTERTPDSAEMQWIDETYGSLWEFAVQYKNWEA